MTTSDEAEIGDMAAVLMMSLLLAAILIGGGMFVYNNNIVDKTGRRSDGYPRPAPRQAPYSTRGQEPAMSAAITPSQPGGAQAVPAPAIPAAPPLPEQP